MDHTSIDIYLVIDTFLLLLIGVGPKIALVPFLEVTAEMDPATKATRGPQDAHHRGRRRGPPRRTRRVVGEAAAFFDGVAVNRRGRHPDHHRGHDGSRISRPAGEPSDQGTDPTRIAVFPLAVPYLLNPAGSSRW